MWCEKKNTRFSKQYGRRIALEACLAQSCPFRDECSEYKAISVEEESLAIKRLQKHGHKSHIPPQLILFQKVRHLSGSDKEKLSTMSRF